MDDETRSLDRRLALGVVDASSSPGLRCAFSVVVYSSCGQPAITVEYREVEDYTLSRAELRTVQAISDDATRDVRKLLPSLPRTLVLQVIPSGDDVIDEVGYTVETGGDTVYWGVRPDPADGITVIAETYLRPVMFEMFFRLVRTESLGYRRSLADHMINSGLETVFARDFAATTYPWTTYPPEVEDWVAELLALPAGEHYPWMIRHPDGRRWLGIKAGTYLVDRATQASGRSVVDLVSTPTDEIIKMAQGQLLRTQPAAVERRPRN